MTPKRVFRLLILILIVALAGNRILGGHFVLAAPAKQSAANVVISEFRLVGPAGGNDEFVEIYNPTNLTIPIGGWQLRGSNNAGSTSTRAAVPSGVMLAPGQFYLFANSGYTGAVAADVSYSVGITNDGGIALYDPINNIIVDQVGLSVGSAYQEGSILTPLTTNTDRGYERRYGGSLGHCQDSNNNAADFVLLAPSNPQNSSSPQVACAAPTDTPTPTETDTPTQTSTPTVTPLASNTPTPTATVVYPARMLLINEVAWAGTAANSAHEWIELYNPGAAPIDLSGWRLVSAGDTPAINIALSGAISAGGYFLLERSTDNTVSNIAADQIYTGALSNDGDTLRLIAPDGVTVVDTANFNPSSAIDPWPAGSASPNYASMERAGIIPDSDTAWFTYAGAPGPARDANNAFLRGSPRAANWAYTVTATPFPTRTPTRTPTPTRPATAVPVRTATPIVEAVVINEFLPRAGSDWNGDGQTDTGDEYIELINIGPQPVNLKGWRLNVISGLSVTYILPDVTLLPDEKIVFFKNETALNLSDGGGTLRLLRPNGTPYDAVTYGLVLAADRAWCRNPDGRGAWLDSCDPSPRRANVPLAGARTPAPPAVTPAQRPGYPPPESCPLRGAPGEIIRAECDSPGLGLSNPKYLYKYKRP